MKYPGLEPHQDERRKLMPNDIEELREMYESGGETHRTLAKKFGISHTTVRYHLVNKEKRDEINKRRYELITHQLDDPKFSEKHKQAKKKSFKKSLEKSEELRKWKAKQTYKWKKKRYHSDDDFRKQTRKEATESYYRNKRQRCEGVGKTRQCGSYRTHLFKGMYLCNTHKPIITSLEGELC